MKQGRTLTSVAEEIQRQQDQKRDLVAPVAAVSLAYPVSGDEGEGTFRLEVGEEDFGITGLCHKQVGQFCNIPAQYYDRMLSAFPALLVENVNTWMQHLEEDAKPARRMVRTLDGTARAFLSDRYRTIDNYDLAEAVLPVLHEHDDLEVVSCELTPTRLYIKAVNHAIKAEVGVGDVVEAGVVIRNSEVGHGALAIEPLVFRLICLNGMVSADRKLRKMHLGRANGAGEDGVWETFTDRTRELSDRALWSQVKDVTRAALDQALLDEAAAKLRSAAGDAITGDPFKVIDITAKTVGLNEAEKAGVLTAFLTADDRTRYGLMNAITRASQDVVDYDRASELERIGGHVIELPRKDWERIAVAA